MVNKNSKLMVDSELLAKIKKLELYYGIYAKKSAKKCKKILR